MQDAWQLKRGASEPAQFRQGSGSGEWVRTYWV